MIEAMLCQTIPEQNLMELVNATCRSLGARERELHRHTLIQEALVRLSKE